MIPTLATDQLACQLLKFEQQLTAYEKLHQGELTELWQALNDCKQALVAIVTDVDPPSAEGLAKQSAQELAEELNDVSEMANAPVSFDHRKNF